MDRITKVKNVKFPSGNIYIDSLLFNGCKWDWEQGDKKTLTYYFCNKLDFKNNKIAKELIKSLKTGYLEIKVLDWKEKEKHSMIKGLKIWTQIIGMPDPIEVKDIKDANLKWYICNPIDKKIGAVQIGPMLKDKYLGYGFYFRHKGNLWENSLEMGGDGFLTILHEVGHSLGLSHPHSSNISKGGIKFPGVLNKRHKGEYGLNNIMYTVMSYNKENYDITESENILPHTPGPLDIVAIQYLYGINTNYKKGNNTYFLFDTNKKNNYNCIFDSGGKDMIVYKGNKAVILDLRPGIIKEEGKITNINKIKGSNTGFTISKNTVIENVISGSGDDQIQQVDSVSNIIDGNMGVDTVIYEDVQKNYEIIKKASIIFSYIIIKKNNIEDHLYNIEKIVFKDTTILVKDIPKKTD
jgi:serralysin